MGKVGSIFRDARLGKGLTLEQVSDETNISKRFLQGIETDNFEGFPGEVYILGFLRNYAEFLGLDATRIVELYRQHGEEPEQVADIPPAAGDIPAPGEKPEAVSNAEALPLQTAEPIEKKEEQETPAKPHSQAPSLFPEPEGEEGLSSAASSEASKQRKVTTNKRSRVKTEAHGGQGKEREESRSSDIREPSPSKQTQQASAPSHSPPSRSAFIQAGRLLPFVLLGLVLLIAAISIIPKLTLPSATSRPPSEYRAEGLPFEQRLYPQDKVYLPLGDDFVSITLKAIKDKVTFDTPYGALTAGLNEEAVINPSAERERLIATVTDYSPNEPKNGALVRFDVKEALSKAESSGDITVPAAESNQAAVPQTPQAQTLSPVVLFRSPGGPHPFYVNVSFMSPVLFRYEADKKEWVEKYYRKGESITINASNSITFWTANAQSVKVNVFQSAGKSTELVMGGAGEIAVQRLAWSNAQGGWAMVAVPLD